MAVAAPKRRSQSQAAPAPSRTAPPEPKKRPRDRPRPGGPGRSAAAAAPATAPKRKPAAPKRKAQTAAPARKVAPRRKAAAAPARKTAPKRRAPGRVIPIAAGTVGRTAVAVTQLPESGLIHRLTRGRAWIGLLGVLLIGIVALNVVTLSFAASAGKVEERNLALSKDISVAQTRLAEKNGQEKLHNAANQLGLSTNMKVEPTPLTVTKGAVGTAAARLAAASGAAATGEGESSTGETEVASSAGGAIAGEGNMTAEEAAEVNLEGLSQEELNAIYEETLAREAAEAEAAVTEVPAG